ncbi:MAG: PilZ domain-containing protein [Deltaproteobacteria bacterium]|nr:PilZ domain-containing protein [Deltaproteobacteria bacterium]
MEKRQGTRRKSCFRMQYLPLDAEGNFRPKDATIVDLSIGGVRCESAEKLHVGTRLELHFPDAPAENRKSLKDVGIVVWCIQPTPQDPLYRMGIKYL